MGAEARGLAERQFKGVLSAGPSGFRALLGVRLGPGGALDPGGARLFNLTSARCARRQEAAAARDIIQLWARLRYQQDPEAGCYNFDVRAYGGTDSPLVRELRACEAPRDIQAHVKSLNESGALAAIADRAMALPAPPGQKRRLGGHGGGGPRPRHRRRVLPGSEASGEASAPPAAAAAEEEEEAEEERSDGGGLEQPPDAAMEDGAQALCALAQSAAPPPPSPRPAPAALPRATSPAAEAAELLSGAAQHADAQRGPPSEPRDMARLPGERPRVARPTPARQARKWWQPGAHPPQQQPQPPQQQREQLPHTPQQQREQLPRRPQPAPAAAEEGRQQQHMQQQHMQLLHRAIASALARQQRAAAAQQESPPLVCGGGIRLTLHTPLTLELPQRDPLAAARPPALPQPWQQPLIPLPPDFSLYPHLSPPRLPAALGGRPVAPPLPPFWSSDALPGRSSALAAATAAAAAVADLQFQLHRPPPVTTPAPPSRPLVRDHGAAAASPSVRPPAGLLPASPVYRGSVLA